MQYCELDLTDWGYKTRFIVMLRDIWLEERVPKHMFRAYMYKNWGIYLRFQRLSNTQISVERAYIVDPRKYALFVLAHGDYSA